MHRVGSLNFKVKFECTPICPKFRWPDLIVLSVAKAMRRRRLVLVTFIFMHLLKKILLILPELSIWLFLLENAEQQCNKVKCMFWIMHTWGKCCEYKALETGPQILDVIIEFHSICKCSACFQGNHKYAQPLLFPGHGLFLYEWKYVYFLNYYYLFLLSTVHSIQSEEMGALF